MKQRLIDANALHWRIGVDQDDKQIFYVTGAMKNAGTARRWTSPSKRCRSFGREPHEHSEV